MARVNFGRSASTRGYNPLENMVKPGYIIKKGAHYFMVDSIEGMNYQVLVTANGNTAGTEVGNGYDSGFFEDKDLEPFRNHMYFLMPALSRQPKFISRDGSYNGVGFPNDTSEHTLSGALKTIGAASRDKVGDISGRCFLQHPAGIPRWSADEAPGDDKTGWIDVHNSPQDDPNPAFGIWISEGEANLPNFRFLNVTGETIYDPVIYLEGYKIRVVPLSPQRVEQMKAQNGGKLHYRIVSEYGLPHAGTMQDDFTI